MSKAFGTKFYIIDETQFRLGGTRGRFEHRVSIGFGLREFMYFVDTWNGNTYIEEITGGRGPNLITDDSLWNELANFVEINGYSVMAFNEKSIGG